MTGRKLESFPSMRRALCLIALLLLPLAAQPGRSITLQATRNTRDLGGLPLAEGTVFKKGMLYRSGALCFLTRSDVSRMSKLKLRTLIDLRLDKEIARDGKDRVTGVPLVRLPMANSRGLRREAYHYYIRENARAFQGFYAVLARPESYPVLFHCSAGKDRTGILAAVLLEQLGSKRSVILDDYMQSVRNSAGLEVHPEWIQEVFDYEDACGGTAQFLVQNGVSLERQAAVKELLVETQPGL